MAVTIDGEGPADGTPEARFVICWCGTPDCDRYPDVIGGGQYQVTTCMRCKITGVCRPDNDYYVSPLWDGRVCEKCLLELIGEARRKAQSNDD